MSGRRRVRHSLPSSTSSDVQQFGPVSKTAHGRRATDFGVGQRLTSDASREMRPGRRQRGGGRRQPHSGGGRRRKHPTQQTDKNQAAFINQSLQFRFDDSQTEELYQQFWNFQQLPPVYLILWSLVIISVAGAAVIGRVKTDVSSSHSPAEFVICCICAVIGLALIVVLHVHGVAERLKRMKLFSYVILGLLILAYIALLASTRQRTASMYLGYYILLLHILYSMLALSFRSSLVVGGALSAFYIIVSSATTNSFNERDLARQILSNILILLITNGIGLVSRFHLEVKLRNAFREIRECRQKILHVDTRTLEKEQLLLSLMPSYMVEEMKVDILKMRPKLGATNFRKLYVSRSEAVSILFADIVGFTRMSSGMSATDLVSLLNRLFAKFDEMAKRNHCLRIKILGDCYYCVAGDLDNPLFDSTVTRKKVVDPNVPEDHASCCVEMALDIVVAIRIANENPLVKDKGNHVSMRVGVHTGYALCGVVGLLKWQYDVWSDDVTLANHMESGGQAGRVHISKSTLDSMKLHVNDSSLNAKYIISDGDGASRDDYLRKHNVTTYFVEPQARRHVPELESYFQQLGSQSSEGAEGDASECRLESIAESSRESPEDPVEASSQADPINGPPISRNARGKLTRYHKALSKAAIETEAVNNAIRRTLDEDTMLHSADKDEHLQTQRPEDEDQGNGELERQRQEREQQDQKRKVVRRFLNVHFFSILKPLVSKNCSLITNRFHNGPLEEKYHQRQDLTFKYYMPVALCLLYSILLVQALMLPRTWYTAGFTIGGVILLMLLTWLLGAAFQTSIPKRQEADSEISWRFPIKLLRRLISQNSIIRDLIGLFVVLLISSASIINSASCDLQCIKERNCSFVNASLEFVDADSLFCDYPNYFLYCCMLALMASVVFLSMHSFIRIPLVIIVTVVFEVLLLYLLEPLFWVYDVRRIQLTSMSQCSVMKDSFIENALLLAFLGFILVLQSRQVDHWHRLEFVKEQETITAVDDLVKVDEIKQVVLETILPQNIAEYYMKFKSTEVGVDEDLYAEKYADACVMFASIPEYMSHYNVCAQNGKPIEALRLLNEILSDFDSLIQGKLRFAHVEKIKTIGATYMAATGIEHSQRRKKGKGSKHDNDTQLENEREAEDHDNSARLAVSDHDRRRQNFKLLVQFAEQLQKSLASINEAAFQVFELKIGINCGPIVAGVIGTSKPLYDIWGDTVNVASRMESTGMPGEIQVTSEVNELAYEADYSTTYRGEVAVKGKGHIKTYYIDTDHAIRRRPVKKDRPQQTV